MRGPLLPPVVPGHLRHQGCLAVHHLVVRDRQHVVLAEGVDHPEGHVVVVVLAVHRFLRHVAQGVVHPAHVPLQAEAEPAAVRRPGHAGPGRGLLRDGHHARAAPVHGRVHLLEERHRVQVLPAAVLVGRPLALAARVVEVEHRGHRVHAQPVHVELLAPVHGVGDEEVADLLAAVVELQRPPVRVRGPARVLVLVQRPPVELREGPVVAREVRGHPVDDHPDPGLVQGVHQEAEVVRGAHPRGRRVEAGDLVAPRAAEGVLGDRHHLHVREAQLLDVRGELLGELTVGQPGPPRRQVQFVHREGGLVRGAGAALRHPPGVLPLVPGGGDHRRVRRGDLRGPGHRVGAQGVTAVRARDVVLVQRALAHAGQEQLPHARRAERAHGMGDGVPVREVPGDPDALGVRRPHREPGAGHALVPVRPQLLVAALADQVQVQFAECRQEPVRVVDLQLVAVVRHQQPVLRHTGQRQQPGEQPVAVVEELGPQPLGDDRDRLGVGAQHADGHPAPLGTGAQHRVRVVVAALQQPGPFVTAERGGRADPARRGGAAGPGRAGLLRRRRGGCGFVADGR